MSQIECVVTAQRGFWYGPILPNPLADPAKPETATIDRHKLYEMGQTVMVEEEDFMDFDELNKNRNVARGQVIEVTYRRKHPKVMPQAAGKVR